MGLSDEQNLIKTVHYPFGQIKVFVGIRISAQWERPRADQFMIAAVLSSDSSRRPVRYVARELQPKWPGPEVQGPQGWR